MSLTTRIRIQGLLNPLELSETIAKILQFPKGVSARLYTPEWSKNLRIEYPIGVGARAIFYMEIPDHVSFPSHPLFIYDYDDQDDEPFYKECNFEITLISSSDNEEREHDSIIKAIAPHLSGVDWYASNGYFPNRNSHSEWAFKTSPY